MFPKVLDKVKDQVGAQTTAGLYHKLHLSVLAGISLQQFHEMLIRSLFWAKVKQQNLDQFPEFSPSPHTLAAVPAVRIARIMPNMGLRVKAGCAGLLDSLCFSISTWSFLNSFLFAICSLLPGRACH